MLKRIIVDISAAFSAIVFSFMIVVLALIMYFNAPNSYHREDKKFIIEPGQTLGKVISNLHKERIIRNPVAFLYISQLFKGYDPKVRYGEYFFEKNIPYYRIIHKMHNGYISFRKVTIPEGFSTHSTLKAIDNAPGMIGTLPQYVKEGTLLPETYFYSYNDTKLATINRMRDSMNKAIDILWEKRDRSIPIKTKEEAIILASIVEKESGIPAERPKVASVFINRLRKGMRLQSDPTIIYSYAKGDVSKERPIRKKDIINKSPFNTYYIYGLPPTPICNPGIDSIKAVLNPPTTANLYFVASGNGDHIFATNLKDHNRNVKNYYKLLREKRKEKRRNNNKE